MQKIRSIPLLLALAVPLSPAFARDREVSSSGSCTRIATPDRGQIVLTAEAQAPDLQVAARQAGDAYERVSAAIKKLGLEQLELRTVEYQLNEVREWERNRTVSKGFRARIGLKVSTSSVQKLGDVIAAAASEKIRDVGAMTTYLSTEKLRQEQFLCLQDASEDARSKARKLAEAMGAKLGEAISISESHSVPIPPQPYMSMGAQEKTSTRTAMPAPSIEAGQQEVSVNVQASFALN